MAEELVDGESGVEQAVAEQAVWPCSSVAVEPRALAPRLSTLDGATIGFVWDYMFRGDELFEAIERELSTRYAGLTVVNWSEFGNTHGPDEASVVRDLPTQLAKHQVNAVISAVGC